MWAVIWWGDNTPDGLEAASGGGLPAINEGIWHCVEAFVYVGTVYLSCHVHERRYWKALGVAAQYGAQAFCKITFHFSCLLGFLMEGLALEYVPNWR